MRYRRSSYMNGSLICLACAAICLVILIIVLAADSCSEQEPAPNPPTQQIQTQEQPTTARVTFPEGYNVLQIAARLEENGVCSADAFCQTMNTVDFSAEYDFLPSFAELSDRVYYLEGYLFPDTYDFYIGESPESVIRRFLSNFGARVPAEMRALAADTGDFYNTEFSFDEVLTMASIVEREISANPAEMAGCAAVFYNRIKYPNGDGTDGTSTAGYLGSDITIYYPYIKSTCPEGHVSEYDTTNGSGIIGLPKGPICCPSLAAIKAALQPDTTQNAFFFYIDSNAKVYYAHTFGQHQDNYRYCVDNGIAG